MTISHPIILFDGVCNLCNGAVQFIIKRDKRSFFRFASLQSDQGILLRQQAGLDPALTETIVLITKEGVYQRSEAVLRIARHLSGPWPVLYFFRWIPLFVRDAVYNWIARNRYRFFGKKDQCMIPTPELKSRFL